MAYGGDDFDIMNFASSMNNQALPEPIDFEALKNEGIELPDGFEDMDDELKSAIIDSI